MAKGIYVGVREDAFLSTNINNTNVRKWVTSDYKPTYGFKIKFTPRLSNDAWQHILNVGGRGNNTILCLSLHNGYLQLEAPTDTTASTKQVIGSGMYTVGTSYEVEYLVNPVQGSGAFRVNGEKLSDLYNINTSATAVALQMALFNCASTASSDARPTQMDWNYLEIYDGYTLVSRFTPASGPAITEETGGTSTTTPIANVTYTAAVDIAHKVNKVYIGENGVAKNVTQVYIGNPNNQAALSFGTSGPQPVTPLAYEVPPIGYYNMTNDEGLLKVIFNQNIGLEQDTGEDPIQVMLDDGQGTIQSLVYYPGYSEELKVVDNSMYLDLKGGSFLANMPADVRLVIQDGVVFSTETQEHLHYVESPIELTIEY